MLPARGRASSSLGDTILELAPQAIDATRLAEYQRLCGFGVSDRLPLTYPHVLAFPLSLTRMVAADFPFPVIGLVHVHNLITQSRPLTLADEFSLSVEASELRTHPRGVQVDIVSRARLASGERVWSSRSTYLRRDGSRHGARPSDADDLGPPAAVIRVPADIGRRYAAISGDRNPIHLSALTARAFGFPRAIGHGMWLAARALATIEARLPSACAYDVAFRAPVLLPSTVALHTAVDGDDWTVDVSDPHAGRRHMAASVTASDSCN